MSKKDSAQKPAGRERRIKERYAAPSLSVGYASSGAFLFTNPDNISETGAYIPTRDPLPPGTPIRLRFERDGAEPLELQGQIAWSARFEGAGGGMGVEFGPRQPPGWRELVAQIAAQQEVDAAANPASFEPDEDSPPA